MGAAVAAGVAVKISQKTAKISTHCCCCCCFSHFAQVATCHLPLAPRSTLLMDNSRAAAGLEQQARAIIAISSGGQGAWQCIGQVMLLGSPRNRTRTWPPEPTRGGVGRGMRGDANNKMPSLTWLAKCLANVTRLRPPTPFCS